MCLILYLTVSINIVLIKIFNVNINFRIEAIMFVNLLISSAWIHLYIIFFIVIGQLSGHVIRAGMMFRRYSTKLPHFDLIWEKTCPIKAFLCQIGQYTKTISSFETTVPIETKLYRNDVWKVLYWDFIVASPVML
jgi:hypothetical protein